MEKRIAICGLDCELCDAYIATKNNDDDLRKKTAKLWSELNNAPILPEHINCEGCRADGLKTYFCSTLCEVRKCAIAKGNDTCAECQEIDNCAKAGEIFKNSPKARENLKSFGK